MDLSFQKLKNTKAFFQSVKRQIFEDTSGQDPNLILALCLMQSEEIKLREGFLQIFSIDSFQKSGREMNSVPAREYGFCQGKIPKTLN